ncbi:MAG: hypothetical protein ABSB41_15510 [Anaerolineales bacterium]|jgi:hypothetical protein
MNAFNDAVSETRRSASPPKSPGFPLEVAGSSPQLDSIQWAALPGNAAKNRLTVRARAKRRVIWIVIGLNFKDSPMNGVYAKLRRGPIRKPHTTQQGRPLGSIKSVPD